MFCFLFFFLISCIFYFWSVYFLTSNLLFKIIFAWKNTYFQKRLGGRKRRNQYERIRKFIIFKILTNKTTNYVFRIQSKWWDNSAASCHWELILIKSVRLFPGEDNFLVLKNDWKKSSIVHIFCDIWPIMYESSVLNSSRRNIRFSAGSLALALIGCNSFNFPGGKLNFAAGFIVSVRTFSFRH